MKIRSVSRSAALAATMLAVTFMHAQQGKLTCKALRDDGQTIDTYTLQLTLDEKQGTAKSATSNGEWEGKAEFTDTKVTWDMPLQGNMGHTSYVFNRMTGVLTSFSQEGRPIYPSFKCEVARKVY